MEKPRTIRIGLGTTECCSLMTGFLANKMENQKLNETYGNKIIFFAFTLAAWTWMFEKPRRSQELGPAAIHIYKTIAEAELKRIKKIENDFCCLHCRKDKKTKIRTIENLIRKLKGENSDGQIKI